jgi:hypothetical protein
VTWQKVPTRVLCSPSPPCVSRRTGGGGQGGVGSVTIESKLATLFHYCTTFLLDC